MPSHAPISHLTLDPDLPEAGQSDTSSRTGSLDSALPIRACHQHEMSMRRSLVCRKANSESPPNRALIMSSRRWISTCAVRVPCIFTRLGRDS
jgi:hypothetical protein